MSGISEGNIYGGIAQGINSAVSNITNLYGLQKHFEMQQQNLDIHQANAAAYQKQVNYQDFGSKPRGAMFSPDWRDDIEQQPMPPGRSTMTGPPSPSVGASSIGGGANYLRRYVNPSRP